MLDSDTMLWDEEDCDPSLVHLCDEGDEEFARAFGLME